MKPEYQVVVFFHHEMPMFLGHETPSGTVNRLARNKFSLAPDDFDPSFEARCAGMDRGGYVFEVQIKTAAAQKLAGDGYTDVMLIADPLSPREFGLGARDPKELKKKPAGPKP